MTDKVKFLSHSEITGLRAKILENLPVYADTKKTFVVGENAIKFTAKVDINLNLADEIRLPKGKIETHDAHNSMLLYNSISMSPMHACDERIWVYLSHFDLREYVSLRWPIPPEVDGNEKVSLIRAHYFVSGGNRGLFRDHGIARLWWMGYIASRSKKFKDPQEALEILFLKSDVRSQLLERNLGMNPDVFDAVVSILEKDYEEEKAGVKGTLFNRHRFRNLMKSLNRIGGYRMLDVSTYEQLRREIGEISKTS